MKITSLGLIFICYNQIMNNCEICPILATHNDGKDVEILQTDKWRVVLDPNQQFLGKSFVTLLEHKTTLSNLDKSDWSDFESLVKQLERALKATFKPNHFNWSCLMNLAAMSGQSTHVHWHMHPRYSNPVEVMGHTFEDRQWYPNKEKIDNVIEPEILNEIARRIQSNL